MLERLPRRENLQRTEFLFVPRPHPPRSKVEAVCPIWSMTRMTLVAHLRGQVPRDQRVAMATVLERPDLLYDQSPRCQIHTGLSS